MDIGAQGGATVGSTSSAARSPAECGRRIAVVGTTGSGKTTMARRIAQRLAINHVELDALHWGPDWTPAPIERFREHTAQALNGDDWVVDGNYGKVRDIVWSRADTVVWLDYPLLVILRRLAWQTLRRVFTREELWQGNRERFVAQFASRDSLFLWALRTYSRRRREYPAILQRPEYVRLTVVHLRSPRDARDWLTSLEVAAR
jgi:adenylate kinase family enzyme